MDKEFPIRVLIAKPGLDSHDAGAKSLILALREAGMEVIYTGLRQTPAQIARAAIQEDVDVLGLSIMSGAHLVLTAKVIQEMNKTGQGLGDMILLVGGVIPKRDVARLKELGATGVFPGGSTRFDDVVEHIRRNVRSRVVSS